MCKNLNISAAKRLVYLNMGVAPEPAGVIM